MTNARNDDLQFSEYLKKFEDLVMPESIEAEQALLGAFLYNSNQTYLLCRDIVKPEDFYNPVHQTIAKVIWTRCNRGQKVDAILLKNRFAQDETLSEIGGVEYLALLLDSRPDESAVEHYAKLISDLASKRLLIIHGVEIATKASDPETEYSASDLYELDKKAYEAMLSQFSSTASTIMMGDAAKQEIELIGKDYGQGISTGFVAVDEVMGGLHRGDTIVVAGRPDMGKTAFTNNILRSVSATTIYDEDTPRRAKVLFFSLEMDAGKVGQRSMSAFLHEEGIAQIPYQRIMNHDIDPIEKDLLLENIPKMQEKWPIFIDHTSGLNTSQMISRARIFHKKEQHLDLIVVDYIQRAGHDDTGEFNKHQAINTMMLWWANAAKENGWAVIILSQLTRNVERSENKRPALSDMRGSGGLEEHATCVMFLLRKEYYLESAGRPSGYEEGLKWDADMEEWTDKIEVIIAKNKRGGKKTVKLNSAIGFDRFYGVQYDDDIDFD